MTSQIRFQCELTEISHPRDELDARFNRVYELAKKELAKHLWCPEDDLFLLRRKRVTWEKEIINQDGSEGYQFVFESGKKGHQYCIHTNSDPSDFICVLHKTEKQDFFKNLEVFSNLPQCHIL